MSEIFYYCVPLGPDDFVGRGRSGQLAIEYAMRKIRGAGFCSDEIPLPYSIPPKPAPRIQRRRVLSSEELVLAIRLVTEEIDRKMPSPHPLNIRLRYTSANYT